MAASEIIDVESQVTTDISAKAKADRYAFLSTVLITIWLKLKVSKAVFITFSGVLYDGTTIILYLSVVNNVLILLNNLCMIWSL